jgi:hypothetical protein
MHLWTLRAIAFSIVLDARACPATWGASHPARNSVSASLGNMSRTSAPYILRVQRIVVGLPFMQQ